MNGPPEANQAMEGGGGGVSQSSPPQAPPMLVSQQPSASSDVAVPAAAETKATTTATTTTTTPTSSSSPRVTPRFGSRKSFSFSSASPPFRSGTATTSSSSSPALSSAVATAAGPLGGAGGVGVGVGDNNNNNNNNANPTTNLLPKPSPSSSQQQQQRSRRLRPLSLTARRLRTRPRPPDARTCPLLGCFYAEFDNTVGPKVCYQTPPKFMDECSVDAPLGQLENLLARTFASLLHHQPDAQHHRLDKPPPDGVNNDSANEHHQPPTATIATTAAVVGEKSSKANANAMASSTSAGDGDGEDYDAASSLSSSIFASCSDFIITGSELLADKILNLSTHQIHVLSRPALLTDERYERNALLFSVGFVLRRTDDPRPFRCVLNRLNAALADVERESQFLTSPLTRPGIQTVLEQLLVDLNTPGWESNLLLDESNAVHLKLFHPPKTPARPVPEYAVPILLRRDRHVQLYDWDLAVNWVSLHVDGIRTGARIAKVAEVDLDTALQCLRVLRHHSVVALVDMFFFTNRYESTDRAADLLAGRYPDLLQAAAEFCVRHDESGGDVGSLAERGRALSPPRRSSGALEHGRFSGGGSSVGVGGGSASYEERRRFHAPISPRLNHNSLEANASTMAGLSLSPVARSGGGAAGMLRPADAAPLQAALAELYCACRANMSIGNLWIEILASPSWPHRSTNIKWRRVFRRIDHRRFASFGMVHGLIRRMHCYPMVEPSPFKEDEQEIRAAAAAAPLKPEASGIAGHGREPYTRTASAGSHGRHNQQHQQLPQQEERLTPQRVARLMDGRRCDDELVSTIGRPLEELLDMVKDRSVTCVYAPGNHY